MDIGGEEHGAGIPVGRAATLAAARAASAPTTLVRPATARRRPIKLLVLLALFLAVAAYGGHLAYDWWTDGRFLVGTDDAYVQGDITLLAAKATGYVASVEVVTNQAVRAGDVIARIDDGDYRLALQAAQGKLATQESVVARIGRQIEAAQADVVRAQAALDAAHADVTHAEAEFARQSELRRSDFGRRPRFAAPRRPSPPSAPTSTF